MAGPFSIIVSLGCPISFAGKRYLDGVRHTFMILEKEVFANQCHVPANCMLWVSTLQPFTTVGVNFTIQCVHKNCICMHDRQSDDEMLTFNSTFL